MKITIRGRVEVLKNHLEDDEEVVDDPKVFKKIFGKRKFFKTSYDEELVFTQFIDEGTKPSKTLAEALQPGGWIDLEYDEDKHQLFAITEYEARRDLTESELQLLHRNTLGQWSDGGGGALMDEFSEEIEPYYVNLCPDHSASEMEVIVS